jgi:uracil DNA glycosylase
MTTQKKAASLSELLEKAAPPYTEVAMRMLYCTTLHAGGNRYRIREIEFYAADDPYTHQGDEQVSTCGGWYFHRTKPGGGWKGGTFQGLDVSFAPIGTAGGILIRGLSRCNDDGKDGGKYFDGSCNCTRELLQACGVSKIQDLVDKPEFHLSALTHDGIMRLVEHEPLPIVNEGTMEWKATSRVGLSPPEKKPAQLKARKKFHLRPFRFLSAPFETKKEKTNIKKSLVGGAFTLQDYHTLAANGIEANDVSVDEKMKEADQEHDDNKSNTPKGKVKIKVKIMPTAKASGDLLGTQVDDDNDGSKPGVVGDNVDENDDGEFQFDGIIAHIGSGAVWHYYMANAMDGKNSGWHAYDKAASARLEGFMQNKGQQLSRTTWHLKSGFFSYEVDVSQMTQRNMNSGTVRPIRRVLAGEVVSMTAPPIFAPPKKSTSSTTGAPNSKKHEATGSPSNENSKKKQKHDAEGHHGDANNLSLEPLFAGQHGYAWEGLLTEVLESLQQAADFIGPDRSKDILPVREMTFRALMALPPEDNMLIVFGEAPYPRVESASGIAMFDSLIQDWDCPQFGKTVSMRCIAKVAAIARGIVTQDCKIAEMRKAFKQHDIVSPPQWFQAMLAQGVLLLNASLTTGSTYTKAQHNNFWKPVMSSIVAKILQSKRDKFPQGDPKRRIGFLWWGHEALKTKKALASILNEYKNEVEITHIEHCNPAAQGDNFTEVNKILLKNNSAPVDWLPDKAWLKEHHCDDHADFITQTQELHKLYLERLQAGLDLLTGLPPIVGILASELSSLPNACNCIGLRPAAESALQQVSHFAVSDLTSDEMGAVYLYTTNCLYRRLNEALRHPNRGKCKVYFEYLRVFLEAYRKMKPKPRSIYRGIHKDLSGQYKAGSMVTWWPVSSCTPNIGVAKAFGGGSIGGTLFHVKAKTAVPIMHLSAYKSEEEYVLAPGTILKVEKVEKKPNEAVQIYLEEVEGKRLVS